MTYALAKAKIVAMVEAIDPRNKGEGLGDTFEHVPELREDHAPRARAFRLRHEGGARRGPHTTGRTQMVREMVLEVDYPLMGSDDLRDTAIADDATDIGLAVLGPDFDEATTGLIAVGDPFTENETLLEAVVEDGEGDSKKLRIRFPMTHLDDLS